MTDISPDLAKSRDDPVQYGADVPLRPVIIIASSVFVSEVLIMLLLTGVQGRQVLIGLLDALLITVISLPLLQRFVLRPLKHQIDERRRVEGELRVQTAALHAASHGVLITDHSGRICWANPAFAAMTGYSIHEVIGQTPRILSSGEHDDELYAQLWNTILAGEVWQGEMVNRRKDGSLYTEDETITPVRDESGRITHFIAVKADCTQRKQAEAQLAQRNQELLALSQAEHRQRQFSEALVQATHALNASLVLDEVLDRVLEQTQRVVPCRAVSVMTIRGNWIEVPRHRDRTGATHELAQGFPLDRFPQFQAIIHSRQPLRIEDTRSDPDWPEVAGLAWIRSLVMTPLVRDERVTGFLGVYSEQPKFFGEQSTAFLSAFAAHAALAMQNAGLYRAELNSRRTAETLSAAGLALTRSLDLQAVLYSLLYYLRQVVPYDGASIALLDSPSQLTVRATAVYPTTDQDPHSPQPETIELADFPSLHAVLDERQPVVLYNAPRLPTWTSPARTPIQSWMGIPILVGENVIGLCGLEKREPGFFTAEQVRLSEVMVSQAAVAIQNAVLFQEVQTGREQFQSLSRRLVQVQEIERRTIARELHDEAGQMLTSLKLGLRQLEHHAAQPEVVAQGVAGLCGLADGVLENLHRLAVDLRPASLDHLGLVMALTDQIAKLNTQHNINARFETIGAEGTRLPDEMEIALYRIAQEALTNVIRHAYATQVDLLLHFHVDKVVLMVEDNGIGFDLNAMASSDRIGLLGIRERCEMLGGTLAVETTPNHGTTLIVELPRDDSHSGGG